ncbi:MAG: RluA family pseudouridine synthase [Erysipelotrichaceae bacterium]
MKNIKWIITEEEEKQRIDKFMSTKEDGFSRSRSQKLIDDEMVLVNNKVVKNNYRVKVGDTIEVSCPDDEECIALPEQMDLDVIYEDSDVIVVNKPKGIVVHPCAGYLTGTLVNGLLGHCTDLSGINGVLRPGIVHRIDKDTSGLLVVAKNDKAHQALSLQLKDKTMNRQYYALVHGVIEHEFGTIDAPIGRDPKDRQKMAVVEANSKDAVTHFKVLERFNDYTLVECRLETGRTHQIRVHMQYIKHPVVGDPKYSYRRTMECNGQLLHAFRLTFVHPTTNETMSFEAPRPKDFEDVLKELRTKG